MFFFVISGFLMAVLYDENNKLEFFKKRSLRLLPTYFITIILTLIASIFIVTPSEYTQVFDQSLYADLFLSNIGYWMQNSYFAKIDFNPLLHLWSLGVEIQFYLLVPIIFQFYKINRYFLWILLLLSITLCFVILEVSPKTSFFMVPLRLWEFLIGYGVAKYLTNNGAVINRQYSLVGTFFFLVIFAIPVLNVDGNSLGFINGHPGIYALLISLFTGIILSLGIAKVIENSLIGRWLELAGKYSYSIYLVHFPVIVLFLYKPFSGTILQADNIEDLLFLILIIIFLSYGMYHLVENELRKKKHINKILLGLPVIALGVAFSGLFAQNQIFTHQEMLIFDAFKDRDVYRCGKIFRFKNPTSISCEITSNNEAKQNVLLVGNSHADSIKLSFSNIANKIGVKLYFLVPNEPLLKSSAITSKHIIDEALNRNIKSIVIHYSPNSVEVSAIREIVNLANDNNIFVAFIMPVPTWEAHIPKALWENYKYNIKLPTQSLVEYNEKTKELITSLTEIKSDNFVIYPVSNFFCNKNCSVIGSTGKPFYFDNGHLTLTGSKKLSGLFESIINDGLEFNVLEYNTFVTEKS